jgi:hypothetical protein
VGHACLEAGFEYKKSNKVITLILLSVASEEELMVSLENIRVKGIRCVVFYEPDHQYGFTAICTEPLQKLQRRTFCNFPMWESSREVI